VGPEEWDSVGKVSPILMAKFDFFPAENGFLLQVQSDLLDDLETIVVVPLILQKQSHKPISRLNPIFVIAGNKYVMETHFVGTVPRKMLKTPNGNLSEKFDEITNALDMLFLGF